MKLFRLLFCSASDLKFKPLKRLPFGPNSRLKQLDYKLPPPPPPDDFQYPKLPKNFILKGTYANRNRLLICWGVSLYGIVFLLYLAESKRYHRNWELIWLYWKGTTADPLDLSESLNMELRMKNRIEEVQSEDLDGVSAREARRRYLEAVPNQLHNYGMGSIDGAAMGPLSTGLGDPGSGY